PQYAEPHLKDFLAGLGLRNVQDLPMMDGVASFGPFAFRSFPHHDSPTDAALTVESPEAFLFHGNDAWTLSEDAARRLREVKPRGKADLFMGQGGTASGYPLAYFCFD